MDAFELGDLEARRASGDRPYLEFLRAATLSAGLYELRAGTADPQSPHGEDEVYVVLRGRATIRVAEEQRPVSHGSVVFVAAGVDHRFVDIVEDLAVIVLFAPPEGSRG